MDIIKTFNLATLVVVSHLLIVESSFAANDDIPPPPAEAETVLAKAPPVIPHNPYVYKVPAKLADGWKVGDLRKEKADLQQITHGVEQILWGDIPNVHSLVVIRHGKILLEEYLNGQKAEEGNPLFSCTKSVFSTVYGIAQDQGLLNIDQKISDLYPDYRSKKGWDAKKDDITIGNLLSMTSGLDCNDAGDWGTSCGVAMEKSGDWVSFCLGLPLIHPPGGNWMYNGSCLVLLSNLITQKSGMSYSDFAEKFLLEPLGIKGSQWQASPAGVTRVDSGLSWKSRDMAKLGLLYMNKGKWEGKQIVSEAWVKDATFLHAPAGTSFGHSYGYLWHLKSMMWKSKPVSIFYANGFQGQAIFVSPDADLVCVVTASSGNAGIYGMEERLFEDMILGSFK